MREGRENQENTLTVLQCVPYFMIGVKHNEEITKAQINKKIQYNSKLVMTSFQNP